MTNGITSKRVITDGKKFKKVVDLKADQVQLPTGIVTGEQLQDMKPGSQFMANDKKYFVFECSLADFLEKKLERKTQIMYPKEISYLIYNLDINPGDKVGEAGTGSGAMTLSLSRAVGPEGAVYTYEQRSDFDKAISKNYSRGKKFDNVVFYKHAIDDGIEEQNLDAFVLDVREPWQVLEQVGKSLKTSGDLGVLVPTYNQISYTLPALKENNLFLVEIVELMLRKYKHNPDRMRPEDMMIGHTGYLIMSKKLANEPIQEISSSSV